MRRNEAQRQQQQRMKFGTGVGYNATGGGIGGSGGDVIPAMLTPGEFVMSSGAVRQHGIGAMRSLNRGQVPGFNRGGAVGGVQYRETGGLMGMAGNIANSMGIDTSKLTGVFDSFIGDFSGTFNILQQAFPVLTSAITGLVGIFGSGDGFKWSHNHTGDIKITGVVNISDGDIEKIAKAVQAKGEGKVPPSNYKAGQ
tara:strand:- start:503 stop:1093 length:591 start_codon:yes stop_codon:yes gene_type:complete